MEGSRFAQTNSIYRCSNDVCQAEKDELANKLSNERKEKANGHTKNAKASIQRRGFSLQTLIKKIHLPV